MPHIGLDGVLIILGQMLVGVVSGAVPLWVQRKWFLFEEEDQSFVVPGTVSVFSSLAYFWMVIAGGA